MVDYSKWKNIEISDDEDDTHPNIDTPSLFRWRHQARVERMQDAEKEKKTFDSRKQATQNQIKELKEKLDNPPPDGINDIQKKLKDLEMEAEKLKKEEEDLKKKEKITPWNVDTISKPGFAKTVINTKKTNKDENLDEEERDKRLVQFIDANEKTIKQFGILKKYDDSKNFLMEHHHLVCEDTVNFLVSWCIKLALEDKKELMSHVSHQFVCLQYILELAKQFDCDPRNCVPIFFSRIQVADAIYKQNFNTEIEDFKARVQKRADEKVAEALREKEEEDRLARIGPGGLDPVEVFEALPEELKQCFESRNIKLLQEVIAKMNPEDASYHMKRCVDSGLWVPEGNKTLDESAKVDDDGEIDEVDIDESTEKDEEYAEIKENNAKTAEN